MKNFLLGVVMALMLGSVQAGIEPGSKDLGAIWFIGDSITQSNADGNKAGSPRKSLYDLLTADGYTFSYTGHHVRNVDGLPITGTNAVDNLYHYHSGVSGILIGEATGKGMRGQLSKDWMRGRLADVKPNVILIMIGTNDIGHTYDEENAPDRLRALVREIYELPDIGKPTIFLASIPPNRRTESEIHNVTAFNETLPGIVAEFQARGKDLHFVDQFSPLNEAYTATMRKDNLHPNDTGNETMAQQWFEAISAVAEQQEFPGEKMDFRGFARYEVPTGMGRFSVVCPKKAAPGNPWLWRSIFWGMKGNAVEQFTVADLQLLEQGFFVVQAPGDVSGHPDGNAKIDAAYELLTQNYGFSKTLSMASMSRETLALFRWASANPDKVECIYVDNGVCNLNSWPGGKRVSGSNSNGTGDSKAWALMKQTYEFSSDEEALAANVSPIDLLEPLAKAGVPILMGCGTQDVTVPYEENGAIMKQRYEELGGSIEIIFEDKGHHPHGLKDPAPIVDFIKAHSRVGSAVSAAPLYDGSWEALQQMPVPAWFDDGKIGIFIHWGPYSVIGYRKEGRGYAEHVPKIIYEDPKHYYPYMKKRWGAHPPEFGYKDIIPEFTAKNWNPDEWAKLFKDVGAKYVVLTAEHHDGWANWDSDLTPWNAVDKGPRRDLVGDLGKAARANGLKYVPSYHRERHTGFFATENYVVHSQPRPDIAEEIKRVPEAAMLYGPEFSYSKAYVDDYVARWKEIQAKYQPDMLWVDDFPIYTRDGNQVRKGSMKPEIKYFDDQVRGMITDFMNEGAAHGQDVYVNNKGRNRNWPDGVGCLEKDNLKLKVIGPKWQSCTTFGTSFGYLADEEDPDYPYKKKRVEQVIHEMVEIISRNGNFLINIGPKADGTIPAWQVERLRAMGDWLRINGDAIYGTRYWKENTQQNENLSFTTKGNILYAIKRTEPIDPFVVDASKGWKKEQVTSIKLIGSDAPVRWEMTPSGLRITPPKELGTSTYAWSFEILTTEKQYHPNVMETDVTKALMGTKKVNLNGDDL